MRVVGNNLLVRVLPETTNVTGGGIVIPDNVVSKLLRIGEVLEIGYLTGSKIHDRTPIPGLKVGDHVAFSRFHEIAGANPQIKKSEADLMCIRPADVLLVMDAEDMKRVG